MKRRGRERQEISDDITAGAVILVCYVVHACFTNLLYFVKEQEGLAGKGS